MNNTKNNHYVPKFYLKEFCDTDNKIWKLDKSNNVIYHPASLNSECSKKNLYTIKNKITQNDIAIISKVFELDKRQIYAETLNYLVVFLNDEIGNLFSIKYQKNKIYEELINNSLNQGLNNSGISRTQEILISELFEQKFIPIYRQILEKNSIDFIKQEISSSLLMYTCKNLTKFVYLYLQRKMEELVNTKVPEELKKIKLDTNIYFDFVLYFIFQELRTNNVLTEIQKAPALSELKKYIDVNNENISFLGILMLLLLIIEKFFFKNTPFKFILFKNSTELEYVTSDAPCVNIYSLFVKGRLLQDDEVEFFLPLSPKLALLMTDKICYNSNNIVISDEKNIDIFNKTIINSAQRYIYSNSKDTLRRYLSN